VIIEEIEKIIKEVKRNNEYKVDYIIYFKLSNLFELYFFTFLKIFFNNNNFDNDYFDNIFLNIGKLFFLKLKKENEKGIFFFLH
jgi:hypothetical protein